MTYSAVSAKIRAMQGRFLTDTDFSQLAFSDSVSAAVETLKSRPSYSCAFEAAGDGELDRSRIEQLLWLSLYRDYSSLYRFAAVSQRKFLDLYFMHFEVDILKKCLRDAASSRSSDLDLSIFEDFFQKHSHLDLAGLAECSSLDSFVEGLRGSFYYEPLRRLRDQGVTALFDYESALDSLYFIHLWKDMKKQLGRKELEAVSQCIGEKIDLLNLEWLSRAKEYYRFSDHAIEDFLIPVYYKLRKDQIRAMAQAVSREEFLGILRTTRYGNRIF